MNDDELPEFASFLNDGKDDIELDLPLENLAVPDNVRVEGGMVVWSPFPPPAELQANVHAPIPTALSYTEFRMGPIVVGRSVTPRLDTLLEFARLGLLAEKLTDSEATAASPFGSRALHFARRWGILNLCDLNLPIGHPRLSPGRTICPPRSPDPLHSWRLLGGGRIDVLMGALDKYLVAEYWPALLIEQAQIIIARTAPKGAAHASALGKAECIGLGLAAYFPEHSAEQLAVDYERFIRRLPYALTSDGAYECLRQSIEPVFGEDIGNVIVMALADACDRHTPDATLEEVLTDASAQLAETQRNLPRPQAQHNCSPVHHVGGMPPTYDEPLAAWAYYARRVYHILRIVAQINTVKSYSAPKTHADQDDLQRAQEQLGDLWARLEPDSRHADYEFSTSQAAHKERDTYAKVRREIGHETPEKHCTLLTRYVNVCYTTGYPSLVFPTEFPPPPGYERRLFASASDMGLLGCFSIQIWALIWKIEHFSQCADCLNFFSPARRSGSKARERCARCKGRKRRKRRDPRTAREKQDERCNEIAEELGLIPGANQLSQATSLRKRLLSDELWEKIAHEFPPIEKRSGRTRVDDRLALTGILLIIRGREVVGRKLAWEDLPKQLGCGAGKTCHNRLREWRKTKIWPKIRDVLKRHLGSSPNIDWGKAEGLGRHPAGATESEHDKVT